MHYWKVKNLKTGGVTGRRADTFGEACRMIGWDYRECQVLEVTN